MDMNFLNSGLPQLNLTPFTPQQPLMSTGGQVITIQITPTVDVQQGFVGNVNIPLSWNLSIDQHTLRFYIEERYSSSGTIQYALSLVGQLFYNVVFSGVVPIISLETGIEGPKFNNYGSYNVNIPVGVFDNLADVQQIILNNFSINATLQQAYIIGPNGELIVYDPSNPEPFINALNGQMKVTVYSPYLVTISATINES